MKKNLNKLRLIPAVALMLAVMGTSGCDGVDLNSEEEELVIEYAVDAVINHDKNYIIKLAERPTEEEIETTTPWISDNPDDGNGDNGDSPDKKPQDNITSANEAFGISGFTVTSSGYEVTNKYPDDNAGFSMVAIQNYDLLVLKFNVTNNSQSQTQLNMLDMNFGYRCSVNDEVRLNAQVTALLNGLNTWNGVFEAGETKEMVLVFQISEEISDSINKISLYVTRDGGSSTISIK